MPQACSLDKLDNYLLGNVLHQCWSLRAKQRPASAEVRHVLQLQCVCRRFSCLLLEQPLLLELDFSDTLLGERHLQWLASPAWANRVEALTLYGWKGQAYDRERRSLEQNLRSGTDPASRELNQDPGERPDTLSRLLCVLANQEGALQRLHGVPGEHKWRGIDTPPVDLSMFKLTHAGIACAYFYTRLAIIKLPATLVSLQYCLWVNTGQDLPVYSGRASRPQYIAGTLLDATRMPPNLSHVCFTGGVTGINAFESMTIAAERYLSFTIFHYHTCPVQEDMFHKAQTVHVLAGEKLLLLHADESEVPVLDALPQFFCPQTLNEAVIVMRGAFPVVHALDEYAPKWGWRLVMRTLIAARARLFAFEVRDAADEKRVAWRRWPPQGTPAHEAAARLHAEAVRWAGEMDH